MLPPESLTVADLTFKSLIHFKLIFVSGVREKSSFILLITPLFLILCSDFLLATLLKKEGMLCSFYHILSVILTNSYLNSKKLYSFIIDNPCFYSHIHGLGFQNLKGIYMPNYENKGICKF